MPKQSESTDLKGLQKDMEYARNDISEIKELLKTGYVSVQRYAPVEKIVFGMVGVLLVTVFGTVLSVIFVKK